MSQLAAAGVAQLVATAKNALSKPDKPSMLVRLGRVSYSVNGAALLVVLYTGWRNERVAQGDKPNIPIPGLSKLTGSGWQGAARGDAPPPSGVTVGANAAPGNPAVTPGSGVGAGGVGAGNTKHPPLVRFSMPGAVLAFTAPNGAKKHTAYNGSDYQTRLNHAQTIANLFHLRITSGYRSAAHDRAQGRNYHSFHEDGLAFDMVGTMAEMRKGAEWASKRNDLFQEVLLHNEGSGLHLHLAFWPDAGQKLTIADLTNPGVLGRAANQHAHATNKGTKKGPKIALFAHPSRPGN